MRGNAGKRESAGGKMEHGDAAPMSATWMIGLRGPEGHRYSFIHSTFPEASLAKGSAVAVVPVYQRFCSDAPCFPAVPGGGAFPHGIVTAGKRLAKLPAVRLPFAGITY